MLNKENCHRFSLIGKGLTGFLWFISVISMFVRSTHGIWRLIRIQFLIMVIAHAIQVIWAEKLTEQESLDPAEKSRIFFFGVFHSLYLRFCQKDDASA